MPSVYFIEKAFGTYNNALKEAGLTANHVRSVKGKRKKYGSQEEIIDALRQKAELLGRTPTHRDINTDPMMPCASQITKFFGSFTNCLIAAGLPVNCHKATSKT